MLKLLALGLVVALGGIFAFDRLERELVYPFDGTRVDPRDLDLPLVEEVFESGGKRLILWRARPEPVSGLPQVAC